MARRSTEQVDTRGLIGVGGRLRYLDERPADRDRWGALWVRQPFDESGRAEFGKVHSIRQRHAALGLLCQVCGGDPDEDADGVLWLVPVDVRTLRARHGDGPIDTTYPPICAACCDQACRMCPPLREAHTILRAADASIHGVVGRVYEVRDGVLVKGPEPKELVGYGDPRLPMVLAVQQAIRLTGCRLPV